MKMNEHSKQSKAIREQKEEQEASDARLIAVETKEALLEKAAAREAEQRKQREESRLQKLQFATEQAKMDAEKKGLEAAMAAAQQREKQMKKLDEQIAKTRRVVIVCCGCFILILAAVCCSIFVAIGVVRVRHRRGAERRWWEARTHAEHDTGRFPRYRGACLNANSLTSNPIYTFSAGMHNNPIALTASLSQTNQIQDSEQVDV